MSGTLPALNVVMACNQTGPPFAELGFNSMHTTDAALPLADLKRKSASIWPVAFTWQWTDSAGARTPAVTMLPEDILQR
jgi:hypothetical protein